MRFSIRWILFAMVWVGAAIVVFRWQFAGYDWPMWWDGFAGAPLADPYDFKPVAYRMGEGFKGAAGIVMMIALAISAIGGVMAACGAFRDSQSNESEVQR